MDREKLTRLLRLGPVRAGGIQPHVPAVDRDRFEPQFPSPVVGVGDVLGSGVAQGRLGDQGGDGVEVHLADGTRFDVPAAVSLDQIIDRFRRNPGDKVHIIGHSWGAQYATMYVDDDPEVSDAEYDRLERELIESEKALSQIIEGSTIPTFVINQNQILKYKHALSRLVSKIRMLLIHLIQNQIRGICVYLI